jgi:hypothetical protein
MDMMRSPVDALDVTIQDTYWAINRALHGLNKALALISDAKWKDCQQAARNAKEKAEDALIIAHEAQEPMRPMVAKIRHMIRVEEKAVNAPNPEKMKKALMEAVHMAKEIEDDIVKFYHAKQGPYAKQHPTIPYRVSRTRKQKRKHTRTHRK